MRQYIQASQDFDDNVERTGQPNLTDRLAILELQAVMQCTDQYWALVKQDASFCSEAQDYIDSLIRLPSISGSTSVGPVTTNSGNIDAVCVASSFPAPSQSPNAFIGGSPTTPNTLANPAVVPQFPNTSINGTPTPFLEGIENISPTETSPQIPDVAIDETTISESEDIGETDIAEERLSLNETGDSSFSQPATSNLWLNQGGPFYTVSNPSELSARVSFPVSEGDNAVTTTNGSVLNVRSGPGLDSPVIGTLINGASVRLSGMKESGWVQTKNGGWVHGDYISIVSTN
jgi:hypothetical protein